MKQSGKDYKRVVVKIGSSLFFSESGELDKSIFEKIGNQVVSLRNSGKEVVLVSSGAIALGMRTLGLTSRPKELSDLQACAAIGQNALMDNYTTFFKKHDINCAQILLTWDDLNDRQRYLNAKNTILTLLERKCIPIVNENDTISTDEIKFGDNDRLSGLVGNLVSADLLVILSDVEGLLDKDKKVIPVVDEITAQIKGLACPTNKKTCVGGMITKIEAAHLFTSGTGSSCIIASGLQDDTILKNVKEPGTAGTLFVSVGKNLDEKKRWIAFGTKIKGRIIVDDGARRALLNKKSLLSVGVTGLEGSFDSGDIVSVVDKQDCEIARGKVGIAAKQLDKVKGSRFDKEVIHRDNLVILEEK